MSGILGAIDDAQAATGLSAGYIVSVHRHRPVEDALRVLDAIEPWAGRVAGIGMGGHEAGYPPGRFRPFYLKAKALGYKTTVHAGEEGPPAYIREALDMLPIDRIDHRVTAYKNEELMDRLAAIQMSITVCPLSNLRLKVVHR
jgi:adenosine deaminase